MHVYFLLLSEYQLDLQCNYELKCMIMFDTIKVAGNITVF